LKHIILLQLKKYYLAIFYTLFCIGFFGLSSKAHSNLFYVAVILPFIISIILKKVNLRSLLASRVFLLSAIFLFYMFSTLFWAENLEFADIFKNLRRVFYILIFIGVTMHLIHEYPNFLQKLLVIICWAAVIFGIGYILFYYNQYPFPSGRLMGKGQLYNPISAASIYGIVLVACVYLLKQQNTVKSQLLYLGIMSVIISFILLSQSRGPLIAIAITVVAWIMSTFFRRSEEKEYYRSKLFLVLLILFVAGGVLLAVYPDFFQSVFNRNSYRMEIWAKAFALFMDAPWFGHGLNVEAQTVMSDGLVMGHPHSMYLSTAYQGGITGLLLLIALVGSALLQGFGQFGKSPKASLTCMLLVGLLCMVTDGRTLINHPKPFWFFFWFPIALLAESELPREDR
jgi:O-antigen ligase